MNRQDATGRCTTMKRSLLAVLIAATAAPALAEPIDATTPCSVAIQAFGSPKRAGEVLAGAPSQEVLEVGNYILNIMDQLNVDIAHVTINSIGRFMDRPARMKPTIGYGASCNRVLPRVREVRPDPLLTRVGALAIQLIHYVQDVIADL